MGKKDHKKKGGKNESVGQAGNKSQNESVSQTGNKSILQVDLSSDSATLPPAGAGAAAAASTPVAAVVSSCGLCRFPDTEEMVECDECEQWFHYKCVGVGDSVADRDFSCKKCRIAAIPKPTSQMNAEQKSQPGHTEKSSKLENEVEQLRRRLDNQLKAFEEITAKKDEDIERTLTRQRELFDTQLQAVQQQHQQKLQAIQQQQKQQLQAVQQQQKQQSEAVQQQQKQRLDPKVVDFAPLTNRSDFGGGRSATGTLPKASSTVIGGSKSTSGTTASYLEQQRKLLAEKQALEIRHLEERLALDQRSERREEEPVPISAVNDSSIRGWSEADLLEFLAQNSTNELSRSQLAARQAVARKLPPFDGNPEEWPLFIASFESSTRICGYSDEENLLRLQRSLKGKALDTVRCRLLHPSNLAGVIVTRTLFGRPEIIVHSLVSKIKEMPSPKTEKLDTLIEFGVAVQNMCATIKACGLDDYMCNVALLQELVERLPPTIKLNWAIHRQTLNRVNMMDFGDWLGKLVEAACSVTIPSIGSTMKTEKRGRKDDFMNVHSEDDFLNVHIESTPSTPQLREASDKSVPSKSPKECMICGGGCNTAAACEQFQEMDVDSRWSEVRAHKLCRKCLRKHFGACQVKDPCGRKGCTLMHNKLLHDESRYKKPEAAVSEGSTGAAASQNCNMHLAAPGKVLFRYVPVTIHGRGVTVNTYAFLDDGSSATFIEHGLLEELNLEGESHPLCLNWTGGQQREENESVKLSLKISGVHDHSKRYVIPKVHTVRNLALPRQSVSIPELAAQYKHLEGLPVDSFTSVSPRILIGVDNVHLGYPADSHEGGEDQPIAVKTRLGWILYGPCAMTEGTEMKDYTAYHSFHISACDRVADNELNTTSKDYSSTASLGMYKSSKPSLPEDDERALEQLSLKTQLNEERFETELVVRHDPEVYDMSVMTFGATCAPSSARYVKDLNAARLQEQFSRKVECVANEHYVDEIPMSMECEEEGAKLSQGGCEKRNWLSNSSEVLTALPCDEAVEKSLDKCSEMPKEKILGGKPPVKQRSGVSWDEVIPDSLQENWKLWLQVLPQEERARVSHNYRSATPPFNNAIQLHADTSENGVAAITNRSSEQDGTVEYTLTRAKSWMLAKQIVTNEGTKWQGLQKFSPSSRRFRGLEFLWQRKEEVPGNTTDLEKTTEELRPAENFIYRQPQRQPNGEEIRKLLVEVEFVISSRPLTHVPIDSNTSYPLTGSKPPIASNDNPVQRKNSPPSRQPTGSWSDQLSRWQCRTSVQVRVRRTRESIRDPPYWGECHECRDEPPYWQLFRSAIDDATPRRRR